MSHHAVHCRCPGLSAGDDNDDDDDADDGGTVT